MPGLRGKLPTLDGAFWRRFHAALTVIWMIAIIPTMLWWRDSVFWVCLMSLWANIASHGAAYQAARAEERQDRMEAEAAS